ncbi:MAG: response regulator [Candidatus Rokubacteria bacterium]|nr:response regulator [Candidatus Rokubacteria bacterium]
MANAGQDLERADAIRLLAGNIAHDFNNILGVLLLHMAIAKMQVEADQEVFQTLTEAENVALRAQALTQQLLAISGPEITIRRTTAIDGLVKEAVDSALLRKTVRCAVSIPAGLWPVECDAGQVSYALSTLIRHAAAGLPNAGVIAVRAENAVLEGARRPGLASGRYVHLTIESDPGRPPDRRGRPAEGDGGLGRAKGEFGLSRAYAVIDQHEGSVTSVTQDGVGTRVDVYLPATEREAVVEPPEVLAAERSLRVLLMDDEGLILAVASDVLRRLGHTVEIAKDGAEAVALYRRAWDGGAPFDAVILDLTVLGGVGARGAIRQLSAIDPNVRAIVSTGYSNDPIVENYLEHGFRALLVKPYRVADLREALRRVMASSA